MSRTPQNELPALLVITAVAILVWSWAAGETRTTESLRTRATFTSEANSTGRWIFNPPGGAVQLVVSGSSANVRNALEKLDEIGVKQPPVSGTEIVDLGRLVAESPALNQPGVTVTVVNNPLVEVTRTRILTRQLPIASTFEDVDLDGPAEASLTEALVSLPESLLSRVDGLEAVISGGSLSPSDYGRRVERELPLRLRGIPEEEAAGVTITPATAVFAFTPRSSRRTITVTKPIRINVLVSPEDRERITLEPRLLPVEWKIELRGEADVIGSLDPSIPAGEAGVPVAILQLRSLELESGIDRKRISGFAIAMPDGRLAPVEGFARETNEARPEIRIIVDREPAPD